MQTLINVDWLALGVDFFETHVDKRKPRLMSGFSLIELTPTALWARRQYLLDSGGTKIATILQSPRSPLIDQKRGVIEIANPMLYSADFALIVEGVLRMMCCEPTTIPRVDLCCDFVMTGGQARVRDALAIGDIRLSYVRKGVVWWSMEGDNRIPHQISWGGQESKYHWKLYHKWKELHEGGECTKPYIEWLWIENGLLPVRDVWRLEVSISDAANVTHESERIDWLKWWTNREAIFRDIYEKKFVLRKAEGDKNVSRRQRIEFLTFEGGERGNIGEVRGVRFTNKSGLKAAISSLWRLCNDDSVKGDERVYSYCRECMQALLATEGGLQYLCFLTGKKPSEVILQFPQSSTPPAERDTTLWLDFGDDFGEKVYPLGATCPMPYSDDFYDLLERHRAAKGGLFSGG